MCVCVFECVHTLCTLLGGLTLFTCVRWCVDIFIGANDKMLQRSKVLVNSNKVTHFTQQFLYDQKGLCSGSSSTPFKRLINGGGGGGGVN